MFLQQMNFNISIQTQKNFLKKKKINLDKMIKKELTKSIDRYVKNLGIEK